MEILNSYVYLPMDDLAILFLGIIVGSIVGCIIHVKTNNGTIATISAVVTVVVCCVLLMFGNIKCAETRYQGYITNWEEYCEQYDTISVEDKLVTAKKKDK